MKLLKITVFVLIFALAIIGQTNKGGITGTVSDSKGAAVAGATVTITNIGTNQAVVLTTSSSGSYTASTLDPVVYNIRVEAPNFKKALIEKIKVDTASVATVNVTIEVGNVSEEVTVQSDSQNVNTESGTISQTITERQLRDLPLNNRSVLDLAVTMPNVAGDAGSEDADAFTAPAPGFNLSVNGGRPGSTSMLADGVNNTGVGIARAVVSFSPETVQEFSVQSSAYSAEYGTTGGGVINISTKSGRNDIFGTALWYHRNPATNSRPWRQGTAPRPSNNLRSNQESFTVGGPVYLPRFGEGTPPFYDGHNKTFFFFAYEPRQRVDFTTSTGLIPTATERSGNFRGLTRTSSGFLPTAIAAQYGQSSIGPSAIYQQFTVGPGGTLVPIALQPGFLYCQYGAANVTMLAAPTTYGSVLQPQCTAAQRGLESEATNPNLNIIPSAFFDPISIKLLGIMDPARGYFLDNGLVRNYQSIRSINQTETRYTLRLDHNITQNMKVNFRYTRNPTVAVRGSGGDINGNTSAYSNSKQYLVTINNVFSSSLINDLRLNYTRGLFSEDFSPEYNIKTGRSFSKELGLSALTTGGIPLILNSADIGYSSADLGASASTNNFNVEQRKNISDTLYWNHGNMSWKFGTDDSIAQLQVIPFFAASGGRWNFRVVNTSADRGTGAGSGGNALASFLTGVPNAEDYRPALFTYNYQWNSYAFFVQNDWKLKPNLTVNLGLRYSLQPPRTEASNQQGVFRPDLAITQTLTDNAGSTAVSTTQRGAIALAAGIAANAAIPSWIPTTTKIIPFAFAGQGGRSRNILPTDKKAFEPRFGIAWSPKMKVFGMDLEKRSFVIRGGFGVSHFPINGNNRSASPDFGAFNSASTLAPAYSVVGGVAVASAASSGGSNNNAPIRFTGNNAVQGITASLASTLGVDSNGLLYARSLAITGIAVDYTDPTIGRVPYSESWNVAVQFAPFKNSTVEVAYVGNRGVHLYTPQININPRDFNTITNLETNFVDPTTNVNDPLGRTGLTGAIIAVSRASLFSGYLGFDPLNKYYNAQSSSIRHAGYVDFRRRLSRGLNVTANYTFAKSIDDSSDSSPDVRILTTGSVKGQVSLGGSLQNDRALSAFDVKHTMSGTFTYDLPFGKGRQYLKDAPWYVSGPLAGWTMSGVFRLVGGNPYQPFLTDTNHLAGSNLNRTVRPDIVAGVPLKNPLWNPKCRAGTAGGTNGGGCEPYLNPSAFMRPVKGTLGNAPRTLSIRSPFKQYLDLSVQKDFPMPWIGAEGKRKINFRVDALNVLNHPVFFWNNLGNTPFGMGTFPSEIGAETFATVTGQAAFRQPITAAEYNIWAAFNNQPLATNGVSVPGTPQGNTNLLNIRNMVNSVRGTSPTTPGIPGSGALPNDFFHILLPSGFATTNSLAYDITTLQGYKLYRLHQTYDGNFGTLTNPQLQIGNPSPANSQRYLQFGIRLIF